MEISKIVTELMESQDLPHPKKPKTDSVGDAKYFMCGGRRFREGDLADEEYQRQYEIFYYEFSKSKGFVIDWDKFDFLFATSRVAWLDGPLENGKTNDELIHELTRYAIDKHNHDKNENIVFVEPVDASFEVVRGFNFWITFRAKDMSSPNTEEAKLYQTKVWKFCSEIEVEVFEPRPTDEENAAVEVDPPLPIYYSADKPPRVFT